MPAALSIEGTLESVKSISANVCFARASVCQVENILHLCTQQFHPSLHFRLLENDDIDEF